MTCKNAENSAALSMSFGYFARLCFARSLPLLFSVLMSAALMSTCLLATGNNPIEILWEIVVGAFGSISGIEQSLTRAIPLLLCALAVAVPARGGVFNIGAEGQLYFGAIGATAVVIYMPWLPGWMFIPAMMIAAMLAGATWGSVPGLLKARIGVNEILVCLMLNYVAIYLVEYLVHGPWIDTSKDNYGWPYSIRFPDAAIFPALGGGTVHLGLILGLVAAVTIFLVLRYTTWGFGIRLMAASPATARYAIVNIKTQIVVLMAVGGGVAALAGLGEVSAIQGRLRAGISPGYGYIGFLIAWMAQNRILTIVPVSILIGGLFAGADALQLMAGLPSATTEVFMGFVYLSFLVNVFVSERINRFLLVR